jgi:hypothetical protein
MPFFSGIIPLANDSASGIIPNEVNVRIRFLYGASSSMAEHLTVDQVVVGSSPIWHPFPPWRKQP